MKALHRLITDPIPPPAAILHPCWPVLKPITNLDYYLEKLIQIAWTPYPDKVSVSQGVCVAQREQYPVITTTRTPIPTPSKSHMINSDYCASGKPWRRRTGTFLFHKMAYLRPPAHDKTQQHRGDSSVRVFVKSCKHNQRVRLELLCLAIWSLI